MKNIKIVDDDKCELTETLECLKCGGHMKLDVTFIEQVSETMCCPYCNIEITITTC